MSELNLIEIEKICPICGRKFIQIKSNQKYCSHECAKVARLQTQRENRKTDKYKKIMQDYVRSDKYKEVKNRYHQTDKFKKATQEYYEKNKDKYKRQKVENKI